MRPHWIMTSAQWDQEAAGFTAHADAQRAKINRYGLGTRAPAYMLATLNRFERRAQEARSNSAKAWAEEQEHVKP